MVCFKKAIELNSTYTIGIVGLAICYLELEMYQDAFTTFEKAYEVRYSDKNRKNAEELLIIDKQITSFKDQGDTWRKTGSIG
jgi:tetratricopeptide (TPR) repeat protein